VTVRDATPADIPEMMAIAAQAATAAHWTAGMYARLLFPAAPARVVLVSVNEPGPALTGFLVALCSGPEWEIENIAVAETARRRGVGASLVCECLRRARAARAESIFLEVRQSNIIARSFYESCGFAPAGRRPAYYSGPPEDAFIYRCSLRTA
jgi:ribosomal-protein-alanine N-acetyltransferase